jgi:hypothetical protein
LVAYGSAHGDRCSIQDDGDVPGASVRWLLAASTYPEAAGIIPRGGPAIAILVAGLFVAVVGAIVAMEKQRRPFVWAVIGFVVTIVVASAALAVI